VNTIISSEKLDFSFHSRVVTTVSQQVGSCRGEIAPRVSQKNPHCFCFCFFLVILFRDAVDGSKETGAMAWYPSSGRARSHIFLEPDNLV